MKRLAVAALVLVAGCSEPTQYTSGPMTRLDSNTQYRTDDRPGGFQLTVTYSTYTFTAEPSATMQVCQRTLVALAHELAEKQGRKIKPIDDQRMRITPGYNGITGISSCSATAPVDWQ